MYKVQCQKKKKRRKNNYYINNTISYQEFTEKKKSMSLGVSKGVQTPPPPLGQRFPFFFRH